MGKGYHADTRVARQKTIQGLQHQNLEHQNRVIQDVAYPVGSGLPRNGIFARSDRRREIVR
jgi:hypothetical protein